MNNKYNILKSFGYAIEGIKLGLKYNTNLRIHFIAAFLVLLVSFLLKITSTEFILVLIMIILVITTEMINTVIEEVVDLVTKDYREEAKIAKDVAAGMVLVASIGSVIVAFLIFVPHLVLLFK